MMTIPIGSAVAVAYCALLAAAAAADAPLHVSAAISLRDPLRAVIRAYEEVHPGTRILANFDASSTLVRQAAAGAPCDLLLSADRESLAPLLSAGRVRAVDLTAIARGELVLVTRRDVADVRGPADLAAGRVARLALCDETVPVGRGARAWLRSVGVWDRMSARIVQVEHVRAALLAVENGAADAAVVYRTEATGRNVQIVAAARPGEAPDVVYWAAPLRGAREAEAAAFITFLTGPRGQALLRPAGFGAANEGTQSLPASRPVGVGGPTSQPASRPARRQ